jgi:hypothetical protein
LKEDEMLDRRGELACENDDIDNDALFVAAEERVGLAMEKSRGRVGRAKGSSSVDVVNNNSQDEAAVEAYC